MEEKIALYMKNLGLTREEAIELIADDDAGISIELSAEQEAVAKQMAQADRKKEDKPRNRKPDESKRFLIDFLCKHLNKIVNVEIINPEREIQFEFSGALYRLTLAKPRKN